MCSLEITVSEMCALTAELQQKVDESALLTESEDSDDENTIC